MTILEAKNVLNRAGYRLIRESDSDWKKNEEFDQWEYKGAVDRTNETFPGTVYEGIVNDLQFIRGEAQDDGQLDRLLTQAIKIAKKEINSEKDIEATEEIRSYFSL
jgi:hypothetical protein